MAAGQTRADRQAALSRRTFLRGAGACIALPFFESLGIGKLPTAQSLGAARLAQTASGAPLRTAFVYFPNGAIPAQWWPDRPGTDFNWSRTLNPLGDYKSQLQILGQIDHHTAEAGPDGGGDHARGNGTWLTGVRLNKSATNIRAGISIDQVLAREVGHLTRYPSLELACDSTPRSGGCDSGYACAYQYNLSWANATTPMTAETNPRQLFERLFGQGERGQRRALQQRLQEEESSVLDFVLDDARAMQRRLAPQDQRKLDQYLTGVRALETRIQQAERLGRAVDPDMDTPAGIPIEFADHLQVMYDIMVLAFQADYTRVITFCQAHDGSNRSFDQIGVSEGHHDLTHHRNTTERVAKVADIDRWYAQQFARLLEKLSAVRDADGRTLLENSMIVYGSGNADGNRHTHANLPVLLAGSGGGALRPGRYVRHDSKPMTNLFLGLAHHMGLLNLQRFGDSTGRLEDI
ncbi:MAG TPA: DUF1552 domain-containing protein [Gemmataceae bacterium]|nr:DUF1552 domain-containing protein [Gemmataceae bacterium]